MRVGERVGVERQDGGCLIHHPHHAVLLGGRLLEAVDPLAVVVADHDQPWVAGDRVDRPSLVLSGLLSDEVPLVVDRYTVELGCTPLVRKRGDWRCLVFGID